MTTSPSSAPSSDLTRVRTAADAAGWLRHRCGQYVANAENEPSQVHARALRKTALTLHVLAATLDREGGDDVAAADSLMRLARSYRQTHRADLPDPKSADYQLACAHLADTLRAVGARLTHATAPERTARAGLRSSQEVTRHGRDL
ncbi:MAG: hypothetical protein ACRDT6_07165 [Micromonosporaceae bacterium]